jgi:hypothetical protein
MMPGIPHSVANPLPQPKFSVNAPRVREIPGAGYLMARREDYEKSVDCPYIWLGRHGYERRRFGVNIRDTMDMYNEERLNDELREHDYIVLHRPFSFNRSRWSLTEIKSRDDFKSGMIAQAPNNTSDIRYWSLDHAYMIVDPFFMNGGTKEQHLLNIQNPTHQWWWIKMRNAEAYDVRMYVQEDEINGIRRPDSSVITPWMIEGVELILD